MKSLVILGGGTGGTILSNLLSKKLNLQEWSIKVIDSAKEHVYQPGLVFLPFALYGYKSAADITKPAGFNVSPEATYISENIKSVDTSKKEVITDEGNHRYDILIFALGAEMVTSEVSGLDEAIASKNAYCFYTLESGLECQTGLRDFKGGNLVINLADMPVKCPVAPIEFIFLMDYYLHLRGIREKTRIIFTTPLTGAFTKPLASKVFGEIAKAKGIEIVPNFQIKEVDGANKKIHSYTEQSIDYDLLVSIPPNIGSNVIDDAGLGDGLGFIEVDNHTLKSKKADDIFAIGDNTSVPTSKAGSVTHFESEVLVENIIRHIRGAELNPAYDGHSNCFIESGFKKALLIDFNYTIEPLPGKFPLPVVGPFSLLKESRINHIGKMMFRELYWNHLLKGTIPGESLGIVSSQLKMTGKRPPATWEPPA